MFALFGLVVLASFATPARVPYAADFDSLLLLPPGAQPQRTFRVDLNGDEVKETVVVSRIPHNSDALRGEPCEDDEHVVVTVLEPTRYGLKVICNKGVGFAHYLDCVVRDVDRDGRPEIAVNTMHWGADNGSRGWDFLRWENGALRWCGGASGLCYTNNGGVELLDTDGDGRLGVKAWSDWHHGNQSMAETHEHITTLYHWRHGRLVPFKRYAYDDRTHRQVRVPRHIADGDLLDLDYLTYATANQSPDLPRLPAKPRRLVPGLGDCRNPLWSPDGKHIAFIQGEMVNDILGEERKPTQLCAIRADGTDRRALTSFSDLEVTGFDWSPDGKDLTMDVEPVVGSCPPRQPWIVSAAGGPPRRLRRDKDVEGAAKGETIVGSGGTTIRTDGIDIVVARGKRKWRIEMKPGSCAEPSVSPDGRQVAFQHWEGSEWDLYVVDVPE